MSDFFETFAMSKFASQMDRQNAIAQSWQELNQQLTEMTANVERLKLIEESALKVCSQLDDVVMAIPSAKYMDPPDGGDVSLGEQVWRMAEENAELTKQIADYELANTDIHKWRNNYRSEIGKLLKQRDGAMAALKSINKITGDAGFNIGGPLEHCPGEIGHEEAKRLLSLACEYLKDTSKAAGRVIAANKTGGAT